MHLSSALSHGLIALTVLTPFCAQMYGAEEFTVRPLSDELATEYSLSTAFYSKGTMAEGILIATSERVSDVAHQEAAYQFSMIMRSISPQIAQSIRAKQVLCILLGHDELTSQLPQFASEKTGQELDFYNWRSRGFLTRRNGRPTVVFAEEDVLEFEGGMQLESILIHEFGHVVQGAGFDKGLQDRLTECFELAKAAGLWNDGRAAQRFRRVRGDVPVRLFDALVKSFPAQSPSLIRLCLDSGDILVNGKPTHTDVMVTEEDKVLIVFGGEKQCYAAKNRAEYWAEGLQCWYDTNRTMDHDHNRIHTREQLKDYDAPLARLCHDVLGDSDWRFVSPRERAGEGHLKDFDPAASPEAVDPEHIKTAAYDYYDNYWNEYWSRLHDKHASVKLHPVPDSPLWLTYPGGEGPGRGRHVVLVAADQEYRSEQSMPMLAKILSKRHGFDCTVLFSLNESDHVDPTQKIRWQDKTVQHRIPGLEHLQNADLLILFSRLITLSDDQIQHVVSYVDSGKPIIGIRTANHGFLENFPYQKEGKNVHFGEDVLGGSFRGHHGNWHADSTRGIPVEAMQDHPILRGVSNVWGPSDVYRTYPEGKSLPDGCQALLLGQPLVGRSPDDAANSKKIPLPIAWTKTWTGNSGQTARIFHVTMGSGKDYENPGLRRLTTNAVYWCLKIDNLIDPDSSVEYIDDYRPLASGFAYDKLGVVPQKPDAYR
ncbi:MAG: ThuA domain-containing protein [Fuerstiella sp.]|nr:ThuA domain-containing protein [Fuerstiella sp.]